jgi:hypothetical protein
MSIIEDRFNLPKYPRLLSLAEENSELNDILDDVGEWNFDTLALNRLSDKCPLKEVGGYVFYTLGLIDRFKIPHETLQKFLSAAEEKYNRDVYYHNSIHAADVLNSVIFLLQHGLHSHVRLTDVDIMALVIASISHDIGHGGVNNSFLIQSEDKLAIKYND